MWEMACHLQLPGECDTFDWHVVLLKCFVIVLKRTELKQLQHITLLDKETDLLITHISDCIFKIII